MIEIIEEKIKRQTPSEGMILYKDGQYSKEIWFALDGEPWEEVPEIKITIEMTNYDNLLLLKDYPELAVYMKTNNIKVDIFENKVLIYLNYLLDEHRALFLKYNAKIN